MALGEIHEATAGDTTDLYYVDLEMDGTPVYGEVYVPDGEPVPVPEDRVRELADGDTVDLGDHALEIHDAPGHAFHQAVLYDPANDGVFGASRSRRAQRSGRLRSTPAGPGPPSTGTGHPQRSRPTTPLEFLSSVHMTIPGRNRTMAYFQYVPGRARRPSPSGARA
jgi:hypothetical protein